MNATTNAQNFLGVSWLKCVGYFVVRRVQETVSMCNVCVIWWFRNKIIGPVILATVMARHSLIITMCNSITWISHVHCFSSCRYHFTKFSLHDLYGVSWGECARLRENVPFVKVHWSNPKHLYLELNGYGDNGKRKVWSSRSSTYFTCFACCYLYTAHVRPSVSAESSTFRLHYKQMSQLQWIVIQYCWIFLCHVKCLEP